MQMIMLTWYMQFSLRKKRTVALVVKYSGLSAPMFSDLISAKHFQFVEPVETNKHYILCSSDAIFKSRNIPFTHHLIHATSNIMV